jgi:hypothetical protein
MTPGADRGQPLACSLSLDGLSKRKAVIGELLERDLASLTAVPGGVRARFMARPELKADLDALVALEARCCPFLSLTITGADDATVLEVTGPPEAQTLIAELFSDRAATIPDRRTRSRCP